MNDYLQNGQKHDAMRRQQGSGEAPQTSGPYSVATAVTQLIENNNRLNVLLHRLDNLRTTIQGPVPTATPESPNKVAPTNVLDAFQGQFRSQNEMIEHAFDIVSSLEALLGVNRG